MKGYHLDPHPGANVAKQHFAVIYSPKRKRDRFPSTTVTLYASKDEAIAEQDHDKKLFAAEVIGPAKSSEGFKIFYLVEWLEPHSSTTN
jgi:hypothetical protein